METNESQTSHGSDKAFMKVEALTALKMAGKNTKMMKAAKLAKAKPTPSMEVKRVDLKLPPRPKSSPAVADHACIEASSSNTYPLSSLTETTMNVNAKHGGGTALILNTVGRGELDHDLAEIALLRCGFDGNHYSTKQLAKAGDHSRFYVWNEIRTDKQGFVKPELLYGKSHTTILSNISRFGHGGCGVVFEGSEAVSEEGKSSIIPSPVIRTAADLEGSCALVMCSAPPDESGAVPSQVYLLQFQRDGELTKIPLLPNGSDCWSFECSPLESPDPESPPPDSPTPENTTPDSPAPENQPTDSQEKESAQDNGVDQKSSDPDGLSQENPDAETSAAGTLPSDSLKQENALAEGSSADSTLPEALQENPSKEGLKQKSVEVSGKEESSAGSLSQEICKGISKETSKETSTETTDNIPEVPDEVNNDKGDNSNSNNKSDDDDDGDDIDDDEDDNDGSEDSCPNWCDDSSEGGWFIRTPSEESFKAKEAALEMIGPPNSHYVVLHNKSATFAEAHQDKPRGKVVHLQEFSGINPTTLLGDTSNFVGRSMLVMCSHSLQEEDSTTSALYQVTLMKDQPGVAYIAGMSGVLQSADVWTITMTDKKALQIVGPKGPCRYSLFSNIPEDISNPKDRCFQNGCLATGDSETIEGGLIIDDDNLTVWVDYMTKVLVTCDGVTIQEVEGGNWLEQPDGRLAFQRALTVKEKSPGLKVFRAFALRKDINGADVSIELGDSPHQVIKEPPGVAYALNCGGPAYEALNGTVYIDTQTQFKAIEAGGLDCMHKFSAHTAQDRNLHSLLGSTYDSYLFSSYNCTHDGFFDKMTFPLPLSTGDYMMRLYTVGGWMAKGLIHFNNTELTSKVIEQLTSEDHIHAVGTTAKTCEVPITVEDEKEATLSFHTNGDDVCLSGILVYDKNFKEPTLTTEEKQKEMKIKQELADKLLPFNRTFSLKEMKIAGWSQNLLENASGENGDMSNWNYSGDFKVDDGGDGTEKKFLTSFMVCTKSQDVDLLQHFSQEHLDSAPEIQVSESFHEGGCKGGYYSLTVSLLDADDKVIATKTTGRKGSITNPGWIKESFTFKDYGPGVRTVSFESHGEDDKSWAGYFGSWMSGAALRVKSEISAARGDEYSDVETSTAEERKQGVTSFLRQLQEEHRDSLKFMLSSPEDDNEPVKQVEVKQQENVPPVVVKKKPVKREIRVFVSSTFRDFEEEREMIIKKVFRELNRLCLDRGVFFTYVDLRWGITEMQTKSGRTIEICLREIDKCRPYFICMMGDRFGWSQSQKFKDDLLDKSYDTVVEAYRHFKWVEEFRYNSSVTQLEVMYGAMREHKEIKKERIFFYLRKPRVKREDLPPPVETEEERKNVKGETQWHYDLQHKLRNMVVESGHTYRGYESAVEASTMIKEDLVKCINDDFPPGTNLTALQRESEAHDAFANARRRVYIGRQEYFDYIDNYFAQKPKVPLTIIGESGSGKSALVANWCGRFEEKNPGVFLFKHFIGSSAESASHMNLLRRLYGEMKQFFSLELEIPTSDRNLVIDLPSWLSIASNRSKVMIVLDALNQLDSGAGGSGDEKSLTWLPQTLPNNVQMLLSTLPGETQDVIELSGWPMYKIEGLQENEKLNIITGYMNLYGKTLNKEQTDLIINAKQSSNPLYLKALLDEVRVYGNFFQLTTAINSYLTAEDPGALFVKVLQRLENDFEKGAVCRPNLVRDTTTAIWVSHRGMSENELLTMLKVPSAVWSPFYLSLEENLINRNGLVNFFHDHLRQAVESRYLPTEEDKRKRYLELANFFNAQDIDDRYSDEVPYLLIQAKELTRLKATILNVNIFQFLMKTEDGNFQLIMAWRMLGGFEPVEQAYLDVLSKCEVNWEKDKDKVELIKSMAVFFMQLGLLRGARVLNERLLKELELRYLAEHSTIVQHHFNYSMKLKCNHPTVIDVLIELGNVCLKQGNLKDSEEYLEDALSRLTKVKTPQQKLQLVKAVITMVSVQRRRGDIDFAKKLLMRALGVSKEVVGHEHHYTASLIGQLGEILYDQSRLEEAVACHTFDFHETQREGGSDHPHIAAILNNIGLVQDDMNASGTEKTFKLALGILLEAYGKDHVDVATVRYNLGAQFFGHQMFQRAKFQFEEAHRVFDLFLGDHPSTRVAKKAVDMVQSL
ncbi:uncharacterized protein LOC121407396 [Lytechinus variegatus]|uniref:uncharacterized protein LOC121407396 n=1 Tax=Lytechinus variegatus TaxID=7654 RepID=UPI001BB1A2A7|nr:uncharacterized protein LOC121407396 [Lytechinus variegatus]